MTRPRITITGPLPEAATDHFDRRGCDVRIAPPDGPPTRSELLHRVAGSDALVTLLGDRVDGELLDAAGPGLRCVANVAVGYDNVDLAAAAARNVAVTNTPGVLDHATADLTIALLLACTRRVVEGDARVRSSEPWAWAMDFMLGTELRGKRLGIVGLGAIGREVAVRARAFGMEIAYAGRRRAPDAVERALAAEHLDLDQLVATADVVSLHCPLTPATRHLISADRLRAMKPTAVLVNTARGPIVDERALTEALRAGTIGGAALDVFEHEPRIADGLVEQDNVVLCPHLGSATVETRTAMAELALANALAAVHGEPLLTPVPAPKGA